MSERIAGYALIRELGSGAFGTVWLAEGEVPVRARAGERRWQQVAIKQLHDSGDAKARAALQREFELMQRVRHRSLVRVHEFLPEHDAVVMEAVDGATLDAVLDTLEERGESIPVEAVLDLGMELADCLYQAYSTPGVDGSPLQLVHRDLKPENVMLTPRGEVKVLDFGLARARRAGQKRERGVLGTPLYMSPEQALGQHIDHRTDLFAVGLILYEALMGHGAYDVDERAADPEAEVLARIEAGELGPSLRRLARFHPDVSPVVARCLRADRRDRPADGHEVMVDLQALQSRPRGEALEAFCERFFAPRAAGSMDSAAPAGADTSPAPRKPEIMSNDKPPRPGGPARPSGAPPRPGGAPRPPGPAGAPRAAGPARPPGAPPGPPAGGPPRPAPAPPGPAPAGGPPRPPVGGPPGPPRPGGPARPGPAARPPGPAGGPPGPARRGPIGPAMGPAGGPPSPAPEAPDPRSIRDSLSKSGARTPDEDGMLEMVRLIDEDDDDEADAPKSATAFFKIPKSARKRPGGAPAGGAAPRIGGPAPVARVAGAPPPGGPPPIMGPNGPPPIGGPVAGGMISGPVAGGPMAISGPTAGGAAPFGDIDGPEPEPEIGRNRTRSFVTIAIVLLMLAFLGGSLLIAGGGVAYYVYTAEPESETPAEPNAERPEAPAQAVDTAIEEVEPLEVTEAKPQRQPRAKSSAPAAASPKPAASKPAATGGNLSVRLVSGDVTSVQLVCKGYTRRARFADGAASFKGVPMDTPCVLNLSSLGGPVARFAGAKAGNSYNCSVVSPEVASCN